MLLILFLSLYKGKTQNILKRFLNKDLYIFVSQYNHLRLAENQGSFEEHRYTLNSRLNGDINYETDEKCKIIKRKENLYSIKVGSGYLCTKNRKVIKCGDNKQKWKIKPLKFGFLFKDGRECLTYTGEFKMKPCKETKDQIFDFELKSDFELCLESLSSFYGKPKTRIEKLNHEKLVKLLRENKNPKYDKIVKQYEDKLDKKKSFDKEMLKLKDLDKSPKTKDVLEKLHAKSAGWEFPSIPWDLLKDLFCKWS